MVKCLAFLNTGLFYCQIAITGTGQSLRVEDLTLKFGIKPVLILIAFLMYVFVYFAEHGN